MFTFANGGSAKPPFALAQAGPAAALAFDDLVALLQQAFALAILALLLLLDIGALLARHDVLPTRSKAIAEKPTARPWLAYTPT
jgi:hypothetical protein